jgi:hypothetical protein
VHQAEEEEGATWTERCAVHIKSYLRQNTGFVFSMGHLLYKKQCYPPEDKGCASKACDPPPRDQPPRKRLAHEKRCGTRRAPTEGQSACRSEQSAVCKEKTAEAPRRNNMYQLIPFWSPFIYKCSQYSPKTAPKRSCAVQTRSKCSNGACNRALNIYIYIYKLLVFVLSEPKVFYGYF